MILPLCSFLNRPSYSYSYWFFDVECIIFPDISSPQSLAASKSVTVHAGVRDPSSDKSKALTAFGDNVSLFAVDFAKADTFKNIPKHADAAFVNVPATSDRQALTIAGIDAAIASGVCSAGRFTHERLIVE